MTKDTAKSETQKKLEHAKSIREKAEKEASAIEAEILKDLKDERKSLMEQVAEIDKEITRITGKPEATGGKKTRKESEPVILDILKELGKASCKAIEEHQKMIDLYAPSKVSSQSAKLKGMVDEGKLTKTGEFKKAVYAVAK